MHRVFRDAAFAFLDLGNHVVEGFRCEFLARGERTKEVGEHQPDAHDFRQLIRNELAKGAGTSIASTELTEIMGIRLMLTNLFRPLATGQKLTPEAFDNMVAEVKKRKRSVAEDAMQDLERA